MRELSDLLHGRRVDMITAPNRCMSPRDVVYIGHMLDMAKKAVSKTQGLSREAHDADENLRLALIHLVQVIGEATRQVSRSFADKHPEVPWTEIVGMRHKAETAVDHLSPH